MFGILTSRCRLFEEGNEHDLCMCKSPVIQVDEDQQALCFSVVGNVCASELSGLGEEKSNSNTKLNNKIKVTPHTFELLLNVLDSSFPDPSRSSLLG